MAEETQARPMRESLRVAIEYRRWLREIAKGSDSARQAAGQ